MDTTSSVRAQDAKQGAEGDREADRAAIASALKSFAKDFESRDAKALAAHWTSGGEFTTVKGITVQGREKLERAFTVALASAVEPKAEIRAESVRFLSPDLAVSEGTATVRRTAADALRKSNYKALLAREGGKWLFAQLQEIPAEGVSMQDLAWMIGEWKSVTGQGAEIHTTYSWSPSKKFIRGEFSLKEKAMSIGGFQVIGIDPETGGFHTWTFEADGGVGEADWTADGEHWVLMASGTLADGSNLNETNILHRVNEDTFTWQSINRFHGDDDLADLPPVKVTRVKPAK